MLPTSARQADAYAAAVETHGWDGAWYRRAYFDDGTPLGSTENDECRIDSIAQSWSVHLRRRRPGRRRRRCARWKNTWSARTRASSCCSLRPSTRRPTTPATSRATCPASGRTAAQYTHAALWAVLATALSGHGDRAFELFQMLNPLTHARTPEEVGRYKVEPYVVAADVYTAEGQLGRGGWTWYTGSASWMYRVGLEGILGLRKRGNTLFIESRAPASWPEYTIEYRHGRSYYVIVVTNDTEAGGAVELRSTGNLREGGIPLVDDGESHRNVRPKAISEAASQCR